MKYILVIGGWVMIIVKYFGNWGLGIDDCVVQYIGEWGLGIGKNKYIPLMVYLDHFSIYS